MIKNLYTLTLLKGFDVLNCFEDDQQELGLKEIAEKIGMPQSSIHHIMSSLEFAGLIFQNKENRRYRIGTQFIEFSRKCTRLEDYQRISVKYMELLEQETEETVNLAIASCDKIVLIQRKECAHVLRPNFALNTPYSSYKTGLGMVLLAEKTKASLEWIYENNREDIGMTYEAFTNMLDQVRQNGYAMDDQIFCSGLRCIAAPIRGPGGRALFSVSVSGPTARMDNATCEKIKKRIVYYTDLASTEIQELG